jgi:hypothetical protein
MKLILLVFCSVLFASASFAQYNWKLSKDKDGIKVFESSMGNSNYKSIKVECTLEGSADKLITVLTDVTHHKDWIYNNKDAYLLKKISPSEFYYYTETYLPWPMSNRDAVAHIKIIKDTSSRFFDVVEVGEPKYIPEKSGIVRVPQFSINWHVTMPAVNELSVIYILEVEPGGNVPAWLANMFVDKGPYESFKKLAEILKR